MKNIHLIATDKPSRLKQNKITKKVSLVNKGIDLTSYTSINIYITNDEKIKEGDWFLNTLNNKLDKCDDLIYEKNVNLSSWCKKITITTDQDLIQDGVQAIDDEFLEWFVKNPSCEEVKVENIPNNNWGFDLEEPMNLGYKIIIPKEETPFEELSRISSIELDQEIVKLLTENISNLLYDEEPKGDFKNRQIGATGFVSNKIMENTISKFKGETLEEAKLKFCNDSINWQGSSREDLKLGWDTCAKWQQERMYSEIEDFINWIDKQEIPRENGWWIKYLTGKDTYLSTKELFEQFKKK